MIPAVLFLVAASDAAGLEVDLVVLAERVGALSGPALLVLGLWLIVTGRLVPRSHVEQVLDAAAERVRIAEDERDWWREVGSAALNIGEAAVSRDGR